MGGEGKLNTRRGVGSSAAGRIQHSQDTYLHSRQKTPGQVRPQRPGATYSCVANQEHCYKYAPVH